MLLKSLTKFGLYCTAGIIGISTWNYTSYSNSTAERSTDSNNNNDNKTSYYSSVIIGAGWSGIGVAASLSSCNVNDYIILEKGNCFGYFWSNLYDNIRMNTYQHKLWNSPLEIEPNEIQDYRDKDGVVKYLNKYANYYNINNNIKFNCEVKHINYNESSQEWILNLSNNNQIITKYLTIATSINRVPYIPSFEDMDKYQGTILHSFEYKNAKQFDKNKKLKFLVVGCGNSSIEIAGELKLHNISNDVTLLIRNGRHFTSEKTKHAFEWCLDKICSPSPFSQESLINDNMISCNDLQFHRDIIDFDLFTDIILFTNMSKYGIQKPQLSPTADHYYNKKLTIVDRNTISLIKKKQINIINDKQILKFIKNGIVLINIDDNNETINNYDVIIFGTGYRHGLNQLFNDNLWNKLSTNEYNYPPGLIKYCKNKNINIPLKRKYRWPNLNGRCRSNIYDNLYFAGFDQGYLGGLTIGLYSWAIGEEIAVKLNKKKLDQCTIPWIKTETLRDI